ncbi:hypothetical protein SGA01_14850 [Streptomyces gardneri]|uniref:PE-PGRS family protein n=1 Tax=Streptomyces gardneri TaxID=66892 RepID=A0A4Y3RJ67_9ACTN|nr:hypothetical protein SGA01_14850 [Streptomyces gardneri]
MTVVARGAGAALGTARGAGAAVAAGTTGVIVGPAGGALWRWTDTGRATDRAGGGEPIGTTGRGWAAEGAAASLGRTGEGPGVRRGTAGPATAFAGALAGAGRLGASGRVEASGRADRRCTVAGAVARGRSVTVTRGRSVAVARGTGVTGAGVEDGSAVVGIEVAAERCTTGGTGAVAAGIDETGAGAGAMGSREVVEGDGSAGYGGVFGRTGFPGVG